MTENLLRQFIGRQHFDIRESGNGRWIDQKCAPDAISFVAECVLRHVDDTGKCVFQSPDVWRSTYAVEHVQDVYGKPDPLKRSTFDEYNKFFRQPLKMFAAAGILKEKGRVKNTIQFELVNTDAISFIARNDWNALLFLHCYIEKTLQDSGLWDAFATFLDDQRQDSFDCLRSRFSEFCIKYTPINTVRESYRIFPKVLNPLACRAHKLGVAKGRLSRFKMSLSDLIYNQSNWRDVGKPKDVARSDFKKGVETVSSDSYFVAKAKNEVRKYNLEFNGGFSEVSIGKGSSGEATQMHHMFPQNEFSGLASFVENIIALTPTQHLALAHPRNNTAGIDKDYQLTCLTAKSESIRKNIIDQVGTPGFYSFGKFMFMLDEGFSCDYFEHIAENDFSEVRTGINSRFS